MTLVYIYQADVCCESCGSSIRDDIIASGHAPEDPTDETSYDSDDFPKGPSDNSADFVDNPMNCANGPDCLNSVLLPNGRVIGLPLENPLTPTGIAYVRESIIIGVALANLWAKLYKDQLETPVL